METRQQAKKKDRQESGETMNSGPSVEEGRGTEMPPLLSNSLGDIRKQGGNGTGRKIRTNKDSNSPINPYELTGGWTHPDAWIKGNSAIEASPLAPLLRKTNKEIGFPEDPFPDILETPNNLYQINEGEEKADFHQLTYLYKQEFSAQCMIAFYDQCEKQGVVDRFTTVSTNYPRPRGDLPPLWLIEMGEKIWGNAARKWQGLVAAYLKAEALETRWDIIDLKRDLRLKYPETYRDICHEAYKRALEVKDKFESRTPPEEKYFLISNQIPLVKYMKEKSNMTLTDKEKEMIYICMERDNKTQIEWKTPTRENMDSTVESHSKEEGEEQFHLPTPLEIYSEEETIEESTQRGPQDIGPVEEIMKPRPWRVSEEAPPLSEDQENNLTWEHFPSIEDSTEGTLEVVEEIQNTSVLSIGPHEIAYPGRITMNREDINKDNDTEKQCSLRKEIDACHHLMDRVIGAIGILENIVAKQSEQLTRNQEGQQIETSPQNNREARQPERTTWQGFQDYAIEEKKKKKKRPRRRQKRTYTQEETRIQENAPQQGVSTGLPQRRRFRERTQETGVEQRQGQRRNTWDIPQHHLEKNHRVDVRRVPQQTTSHDFQRRSHPHQEFHRKEWNPQNQWNKQNWQQRNPPQRRQYNTGYVQRRQRNNGWVDQQRGSSQWETGRRGERQWQGEEQNSWAWNWW